MTTRPLPAGNFLFKAGIPITRPRIGISGPMAAKPLSSDGDEALAKIYDDHSRALLGLATLLAWGAVRVPPPRTSGVTSTGESFRKYVSGTGRRTGEFSTAGVLMAADVSHGIAEGIVEDAFAAMRLQWRRLQDPDRGVAFLRRFIVDATRCAGNLSSVARGGLPALTGRTLAALRQLPGRQREALVLRYYAGLSEGEAAAAMGVTRAAFRCHVRRGMTALGLLLEQHSVAGLSTAQCTAVHRSRTAVH
jgi:Sigma-70, region 4